MLNTLKAAYYRLRIAHLEHLIDVLVLDQNVAVYEGDASRVLTIETKIVELQMEAGGFRRKLRALPQPT